MPASVVHAAAAHGLLTVCRFPRQWTCRGLIVAPISWSAGYCYTRRGVVCQGPYCDMACSYAPSKVFPITGDARIVSCYPVIFRCRIFRLAIFCYLFSGWHFPMIFPHPSPRFSVFQAIILCCPPFFLPPRRRTTEDRN